MPLASYSIYRYLCVLLLLIAQQGALGHATWHAGGDARAAREHASLALTQDKGHRSPLDQSALCAFDLAYGQVMGATHGACIAAAFVSTVVERIQASATRQLIATVITPQSRGPPVLL